MDVSNRYAIHFGTVRGVVGSTYCKTGELAKYYLQDTNQNAEITTMEWGRQENEIIIGQKNCILKLYDVETSQFTKNINDINGEGAIVGAAAIDENLVIGCKSGHINIWNEKYNDFFTLNLVSNSTLECICHSESNKNVIATGGEINDLKLWDIETKKCIFKAKSMGHDSLNLPIPTSIRGITFLKDSSKVSICCTKEGYVLVYDERVQRRPVSRFIEAKASFTTITSAFKERQCFVGTTKGYMQLLDLKCPAKCIKTFKSFTGGISRIVCDPVTNVVFTVSLDRYLRIHSVETKELLYKEYLKQSLTTLVMKPLVKEEPNTGEQNKIPVNEDEEYDKLFSNMETISEPNTIKSKKRVLRDFTEHLYKKNRKKIV